MVPPRTEFKADSYSRGVKRIKSRLNTIQTAVGTVLSQTDPLTSLQLKKLAGYRIETESRKTEFESLSQQASMLDSDDDFSDTIDKDLDEVCEMCLEIIGQIDLLLSPTEPTVSVASNSHDTLTSSTASQLRLPKLNLPTFRGDLTSWTSFINLFDTTIHNNDSIPAVMKFQYLLSVVRDEPFNLIKSLSLTTENYKIAYDLLHDRYHNIRRLQTLHLNKLIDLPEIEASNTQSIRDFVNAFTENSQALTALKCPVLESNPLLATILLRKMDIKLCKHLEIHRSTTKSVAHTIPEVSEIIEFLNTECNRTQDAILHSMPRSCESKFSSSRKEQLSNFKGTSSKKSFDSQQTCFVCNQNFHKLYMCPIFKQKNPSERYQLVKSHKLCVSCLGTHKFQECQSKSTCRTCNERHHSLLHFIGKPQSLFPKDSTGCNSNTIRNSNISTEKTTMALTSHESSIDSDANTVLLGSFLIQLRTSEGTPHVFRALLDSGSMCDLVSEHAANILNTRRHKSDVQLTGINQNITRNRGQIYADIETLDGKLISPRHPFLILNKITVDIPRVPISSDVLKYAQVFKLADPTFHVPGRIDVVLGGALFPKVFTQEQHSLGLQMPSVLGTHFGYVVMGKAPCIPTTSNSLNQPTNVTVCLYASSNVDLHDSIQRFWQQEEPPACHAKSVEDDLCDSHFAATHTRDESGRYVVRLPFKENHPALGTSRQAAETRLVAMERKFNTNPRFSQLYHDFMNEYLALDHMSLCSDDVQHEPHYFLPHHGVLKENSSTTKLRTVFDASCKSSSGISLNDILITGRKLQTNICDLLMHFRRYKVVFCCDIRQMYRQILVNPEDRNFQLILWRESPQSNPRVYQLNTVTYGINSSPYLAIRTLHQLAEDEGHDFSQAAHVIKTQTYVNDIITGADNEEDALSLQTQLIALLNRGGFELRKWVSNSSLLLRNVPDSHLETPTFLKESENPQFTVLGLHWSPVTDTFSYNFRIPSRQYFTKRSVLSTIATFYDPCGYLTPFIMLTKCFIQLLWSTGLTWDERLPTSIATKWQNIIEDVTCVTNITIPRALPLSSSTLVETHGFCDASESGYAAIVYFRCERADEIIQIRPIIAKSRVAPLKKVTLPRLELCAAHLLAQLISYCRNIFANEVNDEHLYLWTDSSVVLSWLHTPSYQLKTYVANRVAQTQEMVPVECWRHVPSNQNPADCASGGLLLSQLSNHRLWWDGPTWLQLPSNQWPTSNFPLLSLNESHELKETPLTVLTTGQTKEWPILHQFSSWSKLIRVMAFVLRFCHNCRNPERRVYYISTNELTNSSLKIFSLVQKSTFSEEFQRLNGNQECSKRIQRLNPFLDNQGIIRVGGRLNSTSLSFDARHPVLLPKHHHVVHLLIDYYHVNYLHAGPQLIQSLLAQKVWILCARSTIRSRIHRCITCFKHRPKNVAPLMGDLPTSRVNPAHPFSSTGIDYGGPFTIKMLNLRFVKLIKVYICIFVCMVTKAAHIEVVTDLTTEGFIAALTRFMSRRGMCTDVYSDCGTNFVGANTMIRKTIKSIIMTTSAKERIQHFVSTQGVRFHFNPPAAPHQGGLWESAIKSAKHHLHRVIGNTILNLPEFITLTTRVEAILNSRPLTPLSSDPSCLTALTPGHFLIGRPLVSLPEPDRLSTPQNRLKHWQLLQQLHQRIWNRWSKEYLHTLQRRTKWIHNEKNLEVGDLILVHSTSSPLNWPIARIIAVHPGTDGVVRVVTIKTTLGTFTRPAVKVFRLPIE